MNSRANAIGSRKSPLLGKPKEWRLRLMLCKPGEVKTALPFVLPLSCGALAVAECLHSTLKIIAVWILDVLVPRPATMEKRKRWANTVPTLIVPFCPGVTQKWYT